MRHQLVKTSSATHLVNLPCISILHLGLLAWALITSWSAAQAPRTTCVANRPVLPPHLLLHAPSTCNASLQTLSNTFMLPWHDLFVLEQLSKQRQAYRSNTSVTHN